MRIFTDEHKRNLSKALKGRTVKISEDTKLKMKISSEKRFEKEKNIISVNDLKFEYKTIKGYKKYLITSNGEIYFILNNSLLREKKPSTMKKYNYNFVCLINDKGKSEIKYIHRLVAENFISESTLEVDHIDRNPNNNNVNNLRWVTHQENLKNRKLNYKSVK